MMSLHGWLRSGLTSVLMWIIKMITRGKILTSSMTLILRGKLVRGEIIQNNFDFDCIPADFSDWQGVGQNVARDIAPGEKGKFNVTKLVGHWFRQIRFFDPKGVEEFG
jgi:hypothetical protein